MGVRHTRDESDRYGIKGVLRGAVLAISITSLLPVAVVLLIILL